MKLSHHKNKYYAIALILSLVSLSSVAGVAPRFCEQVFPKEQNSEQAPAKNIRTLDLFKFMGKFIFNPSALVRINKIQNHSITPEKNQ